MYIARVFFPADKSTHVALVRHAKTCGRLGFCLFLLLAKEYFSLLQTQKLTRARQTERSECMLHFMQLVHPFQITSFYATDYNAQPEKKKAAVRAQYNAQPEKKNAADRASYRANCDARKAKVRAHYHANSEEKKEVIRSAYKAQPDKKKAAVRAAYRSEPDKKRAAARAAARAAYIAQPIKKDCSQSCL